MIVYGDPRTSTLWAELHRARQRELRWKLVKAWLLGAVVIVSLLATGIVWPT